MRTKTQNRSRWCRAACLIGVLLMLFAFCTPVLAADSHVRDEYGLFTSYEVQELEAACRAYEQATGIEPAILAIGRGAAGTYEDMIKYMENYADQSMQENSIGLIINMDIRYYYIDIKGSEALAVYTDRRQQELGEQVVRQLSAGAYANAGRAFLSKAEEQYNYASSTGSYGTVIQEKPKGFRAGILAASAFFSAIFSGIVTFLRRGSHKERHLAVDADRYVVPGTVNLYKNRDIFLSQYVTRMPRADQTPKVGGGGFTTGHLSGGGHMHSGTGGHF